MDRVKGNTMGCVEEASPRACYVDVDDDDRISLSTNTHLVLAEFRILVTEVFEVFSNDFIVKICKVFRIVDSTFYF